MKYEIVRDKKIIEIRDLNEFSAEILYEDGSVETTSDMYEAHKLAIRECPDYYETHRFDDDMFDKGGFFDIEDVCDFFVDLEEANKYHEGKVNLKPGDLVMATNFYSPQFGGKVKNSPHYVVVVRGYENEEFSGYLMSSNVDKANINNSDKPVYYDSIFIRNTSSILYKGHIKSMPGFINVGDLITFTKDDLKESWFKGKVSYEFLNFVLKAARDAGTGKNKEVFWEK